MAKSTLQCKSCFTIYQTYFLLLAFTFITLIYSCAVRYNEIIATKQRKKEIF